DRAKMGTFANRTWVKALAWLAAAIIVGLNIRLVITALGEWMASAGEGRWVVELVVIPLAVGLGLLLAWVTFQPWFKWFGRPALTLPEQVGAGMTPPVYHRILVPLDHTELDRQAVGHAAAMARQTGARVYLLHVEEGVTSQVYGEQASTAEVEAGQQYLDGIARSLQAQSIEVETVVVHSSNPKDAIIRQARAIRPDLLIMGAHGHNRWKDLIFGDTINPVRHALNVPILVVRK
ncbi:MAG: universal stress protein, partial [Bryobacteraceae bacterium]